MTTFREHEIEWTREKAARFWRVLVRNAAEQDYFSNAVGRSVILEAKSKGARLNGRVLDYGCGPGHLLAHLVKYATSCEGADFDTVALAEARKRLDGKPSFRGVTLISDLPSTLAENTYDSVFFVETIEHLIGEDLPRTLKELHRVIRPGGSVVVTTPNNEQLDRAKRGCPECGCIFHIVQHVSSWTKERLSSAMTEAGFETLACEPVTFRRDYELTKLRSIVDRMRGKSPASLLYVGRKPDRA
jgi:SAM-dependent methyltransferase